MFCMESLVSGPDQSGKAPAYLHGGGSPKKGVNKVNKDFFIFSVNKSGSKTKVLVFFPGSWRV